MAAAAAGSTVATTDRVSHRSVTLDTSRDSRRLELLALTRQWLEDGEDRYVPTTFAQQMNATSIRLSSSHVAMLSQPDVVASFIRRAARDVQ